MKYLLLFPTVLCIMFFVFWPVGELLWISMQRTNFMTYTFVGLRNYADVFSDAGFVRSIMNSTTYAVLNVVLTVGGATFVGLLVMNQRKKWHDTVRILMYLPTLSAGIILAQVWRWIFHVNGPINWMLGTDIQWFAHGYTAIPAISLIVSFSSMGGTLIVVLAAILSIDTALFDSAMIDGATWFQIKTKIVLPLIRPTVLVMVLVAIIAAPQIFENIYALAPFEYAATMGWHVYREAFQMGRHGSAAAMAVILMAVLLVVSWGKNRLEKEQ